MWGGEGQSFALIRHLYMNTQGGQCAPVLMGRAELLFKVAFLKCFQSSSARIDKLGPSVVFSVLYVTCIL